MRFSWTSVPAFLFALAAWAAPARAQAGPGVFDAGESGTTGVDFDFQSSLTTINANWSGLQVDGTGFSWAVGTTPGAEDVQPFTNVGFSTNVSNAALVLAAGAAYYVTLRGSYMGSSFEYRSDGITVLRPPTASALRVTAGAAVDFVLGMQGVVLYEWDFDAPFGSDGTMPGVDFTSATGGDASFTYSLPSPPARPYEATWRVTHAGGEVHTDWLLIEVDPSPAAPSVGLSAAPASGDAPLTVNLSAPAVTRDGSVSAVYWDFNGDGVADASSASSTSIVHTFGEPGTHTVRVTVVDGLGHEGTGTIDVVVNAPPGFDPPQITNFTAGPSPAPTGAVVTVGLDVGPGSAGTVTRLEFDFDNDGTVDRVRTGPFAGRVLETWQFDTPGNRAIAVTATDSEGFSSRAFLFHNAQLDLSVRRCWITQPVDGARVWGDHLTVLAQALGDAAVESISFEFRPSGGPAWTTIGVATPTPEEIFGVHWDVTGLTPGGLYDLRAVASYVGGGATASSEALKLITVEVQEGLPPSTTTPYYEEFSGSPFTLFQTVAVIPGLTTAGAINGNTLIQLPPGAVATYDQMRTERRAEALQTVAARLQGLRLVHRRKLSLGGNSALQKPGKVSMYVGPSGPVLPDGTDLTKAKLKVFRFEPSRHRWEPLQKQVHTPARALVQAQTTAPGDLAVAVDESGGGGGESSASCGGLGVEGALVFLLLLSLRRRSL